MFSDGEYMSGAYEQPYQTSMMEIRAVDNFLKRGPSKIFDRVLNRHLCTYGSNFYVINEVLQKMCL